LFYNTLSGATAQTNPSQVGYGAKVSNVTKDMTSGGATTTDNPWNIYIDGDGYLGVTIDPTQPASYYTRVGNLTFTQAGYLVDSNGDYILGSSSSGGSQSALCLVNSYFTPTDKASAASGGKIELASTAAVPYDKLRDISFNADGSITATFNGVTGTITTTESAYDTNGKVKDKLEISLATFVNENGLTQCGNNYYQVSAASGAASYVKAQDNNSTRIESNALESSNVDVAREFTNMIITQRGFQANSRVITTSDTMLEEIVNLKRS
jgi:flagellar hook protein FlgE